MEAIKLKARVGTDSNLEWLEPLPHLPEGDIEVILLYEQTQDDKTPTLALEWPALEGKGFLGSTLSREEIYDDDGR